MLLVNIIFKLGLNFYYLTGETLFVFQTTDS